MIVRPTHQGDFAALQSILDETDLFPSEMLPEMISDFFAGSDCPDIWLTAELDGKVVGFCYTTPEQLTDGTWNMRAIAVSPKVQSKGCGSTIVKALEDLLASREQRILIVDTSSSDDFADTRRFYETNGYAQEAQIRDFWAAGDDKIIFWKALG